MPSTIALTLKNYRCFTDTHPATIELGQGFTAFVGPNNSGKSSYLKFLYEFQTLWGSMANPNWIASIIANPSSAIDMGGATRGVVDVNEIVSDYNSRPLALEVRQRPATRTSQYIESIAMTTAGNPRSWTGRVTCGPTKCAGFQVVGNDLLNNLGKSLSYPPLRELFGSLANLMLAPAFRNAINEGSGSYYELAVGTALVAQWNQWKGGDTRASKIAIQRITSDIQHIFNFRSLEINASMSGKTLEVVVDSRPYRLGDLGAGLSQFVILFTNAAIKRPALILMDEPELNLHPSLQVDFLTSLASYTSTGSIIFATHSLGLARAVADRIYTFTPGPHGTIVTPFERTPNYAEFAGEMSFSSFRELGFSSILMVEGPTEVRAVQQFLRLLGRDHETVVMHLGGSAMICTGRELELGELKRITPNIAVLIDSERTGAADDLGAVRKQFLQDCNSLGFKTHATQLRAFENYLPDRAVKAVKGDSYRALRPYERLNDLEHSWGKAENWRIAREMTKDELLATDIGKFIASLHS